MKIWEELGIEQKKLDEKELEPCPDCGSPRTWGEIREVGCIECYYQDYLKRTRLSQKNRTTNK